MKVRIGIDVGGTFTDAVIINDSTYELIGTLKIPTTHLAQEGVASGIIQVIQQAMTKYNIRPDQVVFIAHGTTQATNALLEGDVVPVGVIGIGQGLEGAKVKSDTQVGDIELAPGRFLRTCHSFIDPAEARMAEIITQLNAEGCPVVVASAAFSVDDPTMELSVADKARELGLLATGSHEISKLYGLKIRTRTAAINASILPKMMETANMTEDSVKRAGIKAPLMIMRCDGGVMDIQEVRRRPIMTMLSGPAAGVAGALMYEKISDGIFLEVGGTSTDISAIRNGKVMVKYAEVGGHKTYLNSLDVRTVGVAGGSMVQVGERGVIDVGPRSAHIAGLKYAVYAPPEDIVEPQIVLMQPKPGDPSTYASIKCADGNQYAITVSCAANLLGFVQPDNYAYGSKEAACRAFAPFAAKYNITVEEFARQILDAAAAKNAEVVKALMADYGLDQQSIVLVGGGGGAASIVPHLAQHMDLKFRIARNAEVISPIGVALAMVREVVERTIANPTSEDIIRVRKEAEQAAITSGAAPGAVELHVEVDAQRNLVRVIATGTTELRTRDLTQQRLPEDELIKIAAESMAVAPEQVSILGSTGDSYIVKAEITTRKFLGLLKRTMHSVRVIDSEGVIRVQKNGGKAYRLALADFECQLAAAIDSCTVYSDGGKEVPDVFLIYGKKVADYSGLIDQDQIVSVACLEVGGLAEDTPVYALISHKSAGGR